MVPSTPVTAVIESMTGLAMNVVQSWSDSSGIWRLSVFALSLALLATAEWCWPRRTARRPRAGRWLANFGLATLNSFVLRLAYPLTAVAWAAICRDRGWGILPALAVPSWLEVIFAVIGLDLLIYWQHRAFHAWGWLWNLHRVHHADVDVDASTGIRFHTLEMVLSQAIKLAGILLLGAGPIAVLLFEIILNVGAMWSHSNVAVPARADRCLRWLIVTPDMHRVHHSTDRTESNRNFGFHLSWWDSLFGTYQAQPRMAHQSIDLGLPGVFASTSEEGLIGLLKMPFQSAAAPPVDPPSVEHGSSFERQER
jgi:sterol desaturase/sphingolipid hydroxylase (fatty acid hydroxylase superfamily)